MWLSFNKTLFIKQVVGWIWPEGCSLPVLLYVVSGFREFSTDLGVESMDVSHLRFVSLSPLGVCERVGCCQPRGWLGESVPSLIPPRASG